MVDGWKVEPTGEGVVIMWRRSKFTGAWAPTRYKIETLPELFEVWEKNPSFIGEDGWLLAEMKAAYELELEVRNAL